MAAFIVLATSAAQAQDKKSEFGLFLGTTSSNGISSNDVVPFEQAAVFVEVKPRNGFTWGVDFGYFASERFEIGALYSIQKSKLQVSGPNSWTNVGEGLDVQNIMGTVTFNSGDSWSKLRFYVLGGLGATRYGNVTIVGPAGGSTQIGGISKFATTWGAGIKGYPSPSIGWKAGVRWTPTNIGSTADDWVCSPYGGFCTATGVDHQYIDQLEFAGGVFFRF
jgi:hypothetical protein